MARLTEKEKMLSGLLFYTKDKHLKAEGNQAADLQFKLNNTLPSLQKKRKKIIKELLGKTGESFDIRSPFYCDFGYNIEIGENFFANFGCVILDVGKVIFGDNVLLGPQVNIFTVNHPLDVEERASCIEYGEQITIGNNVWIGGASIILPGVSIGDNSVIGAGSVITKDIPANVLAFGNPCRVIREITEKDKMLSGVEITD